MAEDFNQQVIEEFRANGGTVGGMFEGAPLVLLTTVGARSGVAKTNPAVYLRDGERILVFGSNAGQDRHPAWYHNLLANPDVVVELGSERFAARAVPLAGEERVRMYERQAAIDPAFAAYQANTSRVIPVVALHRLDRPATRDDTVPHESPATEKPMTSANTPKTQVPETRATGTKVTETRPTGTQVTETSATGTKVAQMGVTGQTGVTGQMGAAETGGTGQTGVTGTQVTGTGAAETGVTGAGATGAEATGAGAAAEGGAGTVAGGTGAARSDGRAAQGSPGAESAARVRAFGDELVRVHGWLRDELAKVRKGAAQGQGLSAELRAHCLTFCDALHFHHGAEDNVAFPHLEETHPELADALARLRREHTVVARLIRRLRALLDEGGDAAGEVERLAAELEAHFDYEEEQLVPVLNAMTSVPWGAPGGAA
ncbi:nitroreductase/quinone reductase family protein [Nonomuraea sp. NPDC003804]|uniref:nitroreductase/quinone reductase family protein n=1 Tax=Nonomuraea sp. NPDC003804 TaxID=3154547 RepID=UPI0033A090FD